LIGIALSTLIPEEKMHRTATFALIISVAVLHGMVLAFVPHPLLLSNVVQLVSALFAVTVCILRWRSAEGPYFRWLWKQLCLAFLIWSVAQAYYLWHVIVRHRPTPYPSIADFLWLSFSFPFLLAASRPYKLTVQGQRWTGHLDFAQACLSVLLLYGIIYVAPAGVLDTVAYGIQALGLVLSCAIRFSTATVPEEYAFFWDLTLYGVIYGVIAVAGTLWQDYGSPAGGITDLAWSFPLLAFCAIVYSFPARDRVSGFRTWKRNILPPHIHGVSSLGLALISLAASVILTAYRHMWGVAGLTVSCLLLVLRTAIREARLEQAQTQLQHAVLHDALTALPNRSLLLSEIERVRSSSSGKFLLFLDLDRFKTINDSLGHKTGDKLLVHFAQVLRRTVWPENMVARLGGDEFVVLLERLDYGETAESVAERILSQARLPVLMDDRELYVTASIGIAPITKEKSASELLRDADTAMYKAKALGKDRACTFNQSLVEMTMREMEMGSALRSSIEVGAVSVAYQPVYSLKRAELAGFEALARWRHPLYGQVSPEEFVPLAERAGLITGLGRQVLRVACFQIAAWNRHFKTRYSVSINVSGIELADHRFLPELEYVLRESHLDPALLALEVTESVLLNDEHAAREVLGRAHDLGVSIYLDDFGTGYSSLKYVLQFPFDVIKIDKGFVHNVERDGKRAELLKAIVYLSRNLHKRTIAEGIETPDQMRFLTSIDCEFGQGFLLSRPLLPDQVFYLLQSRTSESMLQAAPLLLKPEHI
jgi:diguanylate cyclase (GGDEF)-like protein